MLDRGALQCTPGVHSNALPGGVAVHPNGSVLTAPKNGALKSGGPQAEKRHPSGGPSHDLRSQEESKCLETAERRWGAKGGAEDASFLGTYPAAVLEESMDAYYNSDEYFKGEPFQKWARESRIAPGVFKGHPPFDPRRFRAICQHRYKLARQSTYAPISRTATRPHQPGRMMTLRTAAMLAAGRDKWYRPESS